MSNEKTLDASQDENDPRIASLLRNRELPTPRPQIRAAVLKHARRNLPPHSAPRLAFLLRHRSALGAAAASLLIATSLYAWYLIRSQQAIHPGATLEPLLISVAGDDSLYELDRALDGLKRRVKGIRASSTRLSLPATRASGTLGFVGKVARRPESEQFFHLAKTAKQAILVVSSMERDAARRKKGRSKPYRVFRQSLIQRVRGMRLRLENRSGNVTDAK